MRQDALIELRDHEFSLLVILLLWYPILSNAHLQILYFRVWPSRDQKSFSRDQSNCTVMDFMMIAYSSFCGLDR